MQSSGALRRAVVVLAALAIWSASGPGQAEAPEVRQIPVQKTEEGQLVAFDGYTWQRRELAKTLPLNEPWPSEALVAAQFKRFGLDRSRVSEPINVPVRIAKDLYLVNSKVNHTYLIDAGADGLILVDPGLEENVEPILNNIARLGFSKSAVRWVINTHAHFDHAMADAHFQRLGAKILIGRADVGAVEKGTQVTAKFVSSMRNTYPTFKVDWPVDDGEELNLGTHGGLDLLSPGDR